MAALRDRGWLFEEEIDHNPPRQFRNSLLS
jgi:homospermidine synthase